MARRSWPPSRCWRWTCPASWSARAGPPPRPTASPAAATAPAELDRSRPAGRAHPAQFADALTEAIHAATPAGPRRARRRRAGNRAARRRPRRHLTPARLAAAAQAALGQPAARPADPGRGELIGGDLFPASTGPDRANLVRLDAFVSDLARWTGQPAATAAPRPPAYVHLPGPGAGSAQRPRRAADRPGLQWLTVAGHPQHRATPAVIIAGADEITRPTRKAWPTRASGAGCR